jgi:hypothetical protein
LPVANAKGVPAVTTATSETKVAETGHARDPFTQPSTHAPSTGSAVAGATATAAAAVTSATNSIAASAGGSTSSSSGASPSPAAVSSVSSSSSTYTGTGLVTPPAAPGGTTTSTSRPLAPTTPRPAASGLLAGQHYAVTLAVTDQSGGFITVDPFERLGAIPSDAQPWLVQLGVLDGGKRVLFAVAPSATPSGPATCVPGPLDCEVLSVAPGQDETVAGPNGNPVTFQITGISAMTDASAAAAAKARTTADAAGTTTVRAWQPTALALFPYVPSRGVVVDERNLIVGGN